MIEVFVRHVLWRLSPRLGMEGIEVLYQLLPASFSMPTVVFSPHAVIAKECASQEPRACGHFWCPDSRSVVCCVVLLFDVSGKSHLSAQCSSKFCRTAIPHSPSVNNKPVPFALTDRLPCELPCSHNTVHEFAPTVTALFPCQCS